MRRETADLLGSGLLLAALLLATFGALAPTPGASASVSAQTDDRGRALFYTKGCVMCHTKQGDSGAIGQVGPDLTGLAQRAADRRPGMSAEAYVRESLKDPGAFLVPGHQQAMPDLGLSDAEIAALSAFLLGAP